VPDVGAGQYAWVGHRSIVPARQAVARIL
jgi:hypothetical protein